MNEFFTSDHHFHHENILNLEDRPFSTIEEMNQGLIHAWNSVVTDKDTVYHVGDIVFGGYPKWEEILSQLNGKIVLIQGNHDSTKTVKRALKEGLIQEYHEVGITLKRGGSKFWLTHYPMNIGMRNNMFNISGHIHSKKSPELTQLNVGVDSDLSTHEREFGVPLSLDEIVVQADFLNPFLKKFYEAGVGRH